MKIRNGFVSNSSSSSFVLYGYKAKNIMPKSKSARKKMMEEYGNEETLRELKEYGVDDAWWDFVNQENLFGIKGLDFVSDDGDSGFIGCKLCDMSSEDGYLENAEVDLEEYMEIINKLKEKFNITEKPKLYMGTVAC